MLVATFLSFSAATLALGAYVPYAIDIVKGKVLPARSTRLMLTILILVALLQQLKLRVGLTMAVTVGEAIGSVAILALAMYKGLGGLKRLDIVCYWLLLVDLVWWLATKQALASIHITILADTVAVYPAFIKTWRQPTTETPLFYVAGAVAPLLSILAEGHYSYAVLVFPLYLAAVNALMVGIICKTRLHDAVLYLSNEDAQA